MSTASNIAMVEEGKRQCDRATWFVMLADGITGEPSSVETGTLASEMACQERM